MKPTVRHALPLAAALALATGVAIAAEPTALVGTDLGSNKDAVTEALVAQGYDVRKIEDEGGKLAAHGQKDGQELAIYVDLFTGKVTEVEMEE